MNAVPIRNHTLSEQELQGLFEMLARIGMQLEATADLPGFQTYANTLQVLEHAARQLIHHGMQPSTPENIVMVRAWWQDYLEIGHSLRRFLPRQ